MDRMREPQLPTTRRRINLARCTLSAIELVTRGEGVLMSSRARRTVAMIDADMTSVDAYLSRNWRSACSRAIARFISPILEHGQNKSESHPHG